MTFASRSSQSTPPETKSTGPRFAALATKCALQGSPRATNNLLFPALNKVCSKLGLLLDALDFALVNHKTHASGWNGPFLLSIYPRVANNRLAPRWTCSFALEVLPFLRPRMTKGMSYIYIYQLDSEFLLLHGGPHMLCSKLELLLLALDCTIRWPTRGVIHCGRSFYTIIC